MTGQPKTGKTRFCLSAPASICYVDTENGVNPFLDLVSEKQIHFCSAYQDNPETSQLDSVHSLNIVDKAIYESRNIIKPQTFVLDSCTSIWQWMADWLRIEVLSKKGELTGRGTKTITFTGNIMGNPSDRRDWSTATMKHISMVTALMSAPFHVIFTAQDHPAYDAQGNILNTMKTSCNKNLPYAVDIIIEMKKRLMPDKTMEHYAIIKDCRHPVPNIQGTEIVNPTFDKIYTLVFGAKA